MPILSNNLSLSSENPLLNSSFFLIRNWCLQVQQNMGAHFHNRIGVLYVTSDIRVMTPAQSTGYASDTREVQPVKSSVTLPFGVCGAMEQKSGLGENSTFHSLVAFVPVQCDDRRRNYLLLYGLLYEA